MAAFWLIGTAQVICTVSYPRNKSKFWLFCMWSLEGLYHALIPKTDDRDKGRRHDCRLLVALFSYQYNGKSQWRARCPAKWWEHSPVPPSECDLGFKSGHECHYVGWVCCWFSPLLWVVFSRYSWFSLSSKTDTSKFQFNLECTDKVKTFFKNSYFVHVSALFVNKLQLQGCCCEVVMSAVGYLKLKLEVQVLWLMLITLVIHLLAYSFVRWHSLAVVQHPSVVQHF